LRFFEKREIASMRPMDDTDDPFVKENRWNFTKLYRERADYSANILRGALFTASTAMIGFIVANKTGADLRAHVVPLILLGFGWAMTLFSWDLQKGKAVRKYDALFAGDLQFDKVPRKTFGDRIHDLPNSKVDRVAAWAIGIGGAIEIYIRMMR
jgi:hypothetical protein